MVESPVIIEDRSLEHRGQARRQVATTIVKKGNLGYWISTIHYHDRIMGRAIYETLIFDILRF